MKILISQNISSLRKAHGMTQEQLAEALGVTFAAVSKWERGVATPELDTIVELADLFCISVDALLGYEMRSNDLSSVISRLRDFTHSHEKHDGAIAEAEKALQRFPNHFEVVYYCATLYSVRGIDEENKSYTRKSLELFTHASRLIAQNTRDDISEMDLWQDIASAHMILGETEKGIAILKAHNPCGLNDALIGMHLACQCSKPDEALPFLSRGMLTLVNMHLHLTLGYQKTFWMRKNYAEAEAFLQWALAFYPGLSQEGVTCPTAKLEALLWAMLADAQMHLHQPEQAEQSLRTARRKALHFDAAPNYDANSIRFVNCGRQATSHDDMGEIAMDAIDAYVSESECKSLAAVWEVVKREE